MQAVSLYVHVPFCLRKCNYCDFVSYPLAECPERQDYPALLAKEWELYKDKVEFDRLRTVYFGGGTPSLLEPAEIGKLLSLFPGAGEVTLEANPETLDEAKLTAFREAGINRLSMGAQSFQQRLLTAMGRGHSPQQVKDMVAAARRAGFDNVSVDLIYGLPGETPADWQDDLAQTLELDVEHVSLYGLTIEENTRWGEMVGRAQMERPDEDLAAYMLESAMDTLAAAGYEHYEISNFAKPGFASRHNLAYWRRENYVGLGVAAAGCLKEHRFYNTKDLGQYAETVSRGELPIVEEEFLHIDQVIGEALFLGLRLEEGIDFAAFKAQYGLDPRKRYRRNIAKMRKAGLLEVTDEGMRLTHRGVLLGNQVFEQFV